jgi:hypothetical protein
MPLKKNKKGGREPGEYIQAFKFVTSAVSSSAPCHLARKDLGNVCFMDEWIYSWGS